MKCFKLQSISLVYFKRARHFQNTVSDKKRKWKVNQIGRKTKTFKYQFDAGKLNSFTKINDQERCNSLCVKKKKWNSYHNFRMSLSMRASLWHHNITIADSGGNSIGWNILNFFFRDITFNRASTSKNCWIVYATNFSSILSNFKMIARLILTHNFWKKSYNNLLLGGKP